MDIPSLKHAAGRSLTEAAYNPRRLILIHSGAAIALAVVIAAINWLLGAQIEKTDGLGGMDTQIMLTTIQTLLQIGQMLVIPFWEAGLIFAAMGYARKQSISPSSLLAGFHRWKPFITASLMQGLVYFALGFVSVYLGSQLFMFTPFAAPMYAIMPQLMEDPTQNPYALLGDSLISVGIGYMVCTLIVFALLALPVFYRYRMVNYIIMDEPEKGGMYAIRRSKIMMKGNRFRYFKLDLSFWWFYLLDLVCMAVCYGDWILAAFGVSLPVDDMVLTYGFYALSLVCQLGLYVWARPKLAVTYAHSYEILRNPPETTFTPPQPKVPWVY